MKCEELNINKKLIDRLLVSKFDELTPIQEKCIPEISRGNDLVGQAETGSGKTLAFCLPLVDKIFPGEGLQAIVLTPTRELCVQVTDVFVEYGRKLGLKTTSVYGGVKIEPQIRHLRSSEIVIGTPGRMLDHTRRKTIDFSNVCFFVLDETDKMFEMGFIGDVEEIIRKIPGKRQTLMFSATISNDINGLIKKHSNNPTIVRTKSYVDPSKLKQIYYDIYEKNNKFSILVHLLRNNKEGLSIVFCATRREADAVERNLRHQGIPALAIHGGMRQNKRMDSLNALKNQKAKVLVATDVAARGLDIKNVTYIYNYDVPMTSKDYIHRIGRTARAGEKGAAVTLLTKRDHDNFRRVQSNDDLRIDEMMIPNFKKIVFMRKFEKREKTIQKSHHTFRRQTNKQSFGRNKQHYRYRSSSSKRSKNSQSL